MPTTLTASSYHSMGPQVHVGVQAVHFRFQHFSHNPVNHPAAFGGHGDTILLAQIPNKALVLDCRARVGPKNDGGGELRMILTPASGSATRTLAVIGSLSISVLTSPCIFDPALNFAAFRLSYSAADGSDSIALKAIFLNSSATSSFSIEGHILYQNSRNSWRTNDE